MEGRTLSHFRVLEKIGEGGMGVVYRAEDERLKRHVALKVLPPELVGDEVRRARFLREARAAAAVTHPNIATIHEIDEVDGVIFIAMEYVEGKTLRRLIGSRPLSAEEAVRIAAQIAEGLGRAHRAQVIHRDLKPENVIVDPDGRVKILDFGLAKLRAEPGGGAAAGATAPETVSVELTREGQVWGTPAYMSPEQARGDALDARSDLFALGIILYEMVTGSLPFTGRSRMETLSAILMARPVPATRINRKVPAALQRIIDRCLEKDPDRRYSTAEDLSRDLERLGEAPTVRSRPARPARRWAVPLAGALLAGAALLVGLDVGGLRAWILGGFPPARVRSLAVLPFRSLGGASGEDYLGLGIADSIISKVSQVGALTVRPTSAIRKYVAGDVDAIEAARQLKVDSVLDGSIQRSGDRLRVSVNLLRASDGASLLAESFEMSFTDIFAIQDRVSREVAARLRLELKPAEEARFAKRYTSNPEAYEHYLRGMYHFDRRRTTVEEGPALEAAVASFSRAVQSDPNYALAHAQLAFASAWMALFVEPGPKWLHRARSELALAERLDPDLAVIHVIRMTILWSPYEGFQIAPAVRELRAAQGLDPSVGHLELGTLYYHIGLEAPALREMNRAMEIDPGSEQVRVRLVEAYESLGRYDDAITAAQRFFGPPPPVMACLKTNRLDEAEASLAEGQAGTLFRHDLRSGRALLLALRGRYAEAEAEIPGIVETSRNSGAYHHSTYNIACLYAIQGKSVEAVKWLGTTVEAGMPNYPMFARDPHLQGIRTSPEFVRFMADLKPRWEAYRREFE